MLLYDTQLKSVVQHCRACGQTKPAEDFPRNRMNKDGLHSYCKPCQNAKCAQYQRNSLAAKQEGRATPDSPPDVEIPEETFATQKVNSPRQVHSGDKPWRQTPSVWHHLALTRDPAACMPSAWRMWQACALPEESACRDASLCTGMHRCVCLAPVLVARC